MYDKLRPLENPDDLVPLLAELADRNPRAVTKELASTVEKIIANDLDKTLDEILTHEGENGGDDE